MKCHICEKEYFQQCIVCMRHVCPDHMKANSRPGDPVVCVQCEPTAPSQQELKEKWRNLLKKEMEE